MGAVRRGAGTIRLIAAASGALSATLLLTVVGRLPSPAYHLPVVVLATLFATASLAMARFESGAETYVVSMVEVPLILGLIATKPFDLIAAWLLGGALSLGLIERQPPLRLAYNLAAFMLQAVVAVIVYHAIARSALPGTPRGIAAALVAVLTTSALSASSVTLAVALSEGRHRAAVLRRPMALGFLASTTTASATLIGAVAYEADPWAGLLVVPPVIVIWLAGRTLTASGGTTGGTRRGGVGRPDVDDLTGLANRRGLEFHLDRLLRPPAGKGLTALVITLDGLDVIRQEHGDRAADQSIVVAAQRLTGALREGDLAGRLGETSLLVVASAHPATTTEETGALGRRLVAALARPSSLGGIIASTAITLRGVVDCGGRSPVEVLEAAELVADASNVIACTAEMLEGSAAAAERLPAS